MDSKGVQAAIIIAVIGIQAIHLATVGKTLDFTHYVDDLANLSYSAWNATTKERSYQLGFAVFVAGASVLIYGLLLVVKLAAMSLSAKIQELLYSSVAVLQFALGVVLAITQSRLFDPSSSNFSTLSTVIYGDAYKSFFKINLADTVLIWVICIPGAYILAHLHSQPSAEPAKAQTSEMGLRT